MADLEGPEAMYRQIAVILIGRIKDGTYPVDTPIASAAEICKEFKVSRRTAISAVDVLREQGLVKGVVGKGTYVMRQPPSEG